MAKTAKLKKRQAGPHSRAARRAASPSEALDKSLKPLPRDRSASPHSARLASKPHVLAAQSAGISKKKSLKPLKRQQRVRAAKALQKGEDNIDKHDVKVSKSVGREKRVRDRRKQWDEVNDEGAKKKGNKGKAGFDILADEGEGKKGGEREWVSDEDMDGEPGETAQTEGDTDTAMGVEVSGEVKDLVLPQSVPLPVARVEEDEML